MENNYTRSWHGRDSLKEDVLTQMQTHYAIQELKSNMSALWQKAQQTDQDFNRAFNALETAAAACNVFINTSAAANTAKSYIFGANGTNVRNPEEESDMMGDKLLQLLEAARS